MRRSGTRQMFKECNRADSDFSRDRRVHSLLSPSHPFACSASGLHDGSRNLAMAARPPRKQLQVLPFSSWIVKVCRFAALAVVTSTSDSHALLEWIGHVVDFLTVVSICTSAMPLLLYIAANSSVGFVAVRLAAVPALARAEAIPVVRHVFVPPQGVRARGQELAAPIVGVPATGTVFYHEYEILILIHNIHTTTELLWFACTHVVFAPDC
jgi:hypothetical protein